MKVFSWNCNGALKKKLDIILKIEADIYNIQECENPAESKDEKFKIWANNYLWKGDNKNKGIDVFAKANFKLSPLSLNDCYHDHNVKHFLAFW